MPPDVINDDEQVQTCKVAIDGINTATPNRPGVIQGNPVFHILRTKPLRHCIASVDQVRFPD